MKRSQLFIGLFGVVCMLSAVGCVSLSALITPAEKDVAAIEFVEEAGVAGPNEFEGYFNLAKAEKLKNMVPMAYEVNMLGIQQAADEQNLKLSHLTASTVAKFEQSQQLEEKLFSKTGLLALGVSALGGGSLLGLIGLMRKRPGDITPEELKVAIKGKDAKLTEKENQFIEIVKGVQDMLNDPAFSGAEMLKNKLALRQSAETKKAVAIIKAS